MTPKEKAKKIVEGYFELLFDYIPNIADRMDAATKCALASVGEVLKSGPYDFSNNTDAVQYWNEVKSEIEKL